MNPDDHETSRHDAGHRVTPAQPWPVVELTLGNCHDASEQAGLEHHLGTLQGVESVHLDRTRAVAHLAYDPAATSAERIRSSLHQAGYRCDSRDCAPSHAQAGHPAVGPGDAPPHGADHAAMGHLQPAGTAPAAPVDDEHGGHGEHMLGDMLRRLIASAILTLPVVIFSPIGAIVGFPEHPPFGVSLGLWGFVLGTPVVAWGGWIFFSAAWRALRRGEVNMMTLISLGVLVSYSYSVAATFIFDGDVFYEAATMLTTLSLLGHWLEMRARFSTGKAVEALLELAPATARVLRDGKEQEVPLEQVVVGDVIVVKPGDRVPVDGKVISGSSYVDEAMITGEPIPVAKEPGAEVIGGTVNQNGSFNFEATAVGADTALSRIVQMVQNAQASKAPAQHLADLAGKYLVFVALGAGASSFLIWYLFGPEGFLFALTAGVSALVIACPDALALATPTAITVGVGKAARDGVLFKNATALEAAAAIDTVVFDKTGTLTEGEPSLTDVVPANGWNENDVLRAAASADQPSQHPLAEAIVRGANERGFELQAPDSFDSLPGLGVVAIVADRTVHIGNRKLMDTEGVAVTELEERVADLAGQGKTAMYVALDGSLAGVVAVADTVRSSAVGAIDALHRLNVKTVMLTGDNRRTAEAVARQLGIDTVIAEVLPEDKANQIEELQTRGAKVAMVGDGVNDAPALAQAQVGIAIGAGTDVAVETAGVVLVKNNPADVARSIFLARKVRGKIKQNLFWAAIYNVIALPIAGGALYPSLGLLLTPEWAALAMAGSTVSVTFNALLLNRVQFRPGAARAAPAESPAPVTAS